MFHSMEIQWYGENSKVRKVYRDYEPVFAGSHLSSIARLIKQI